MDKLIELAMQINLGNLIVMGAMMWFMYSRLDRKFDAVDKKFDAIGHRLDKMQETITDIDRRLCRLEGAFQSKDCCMIKDSRSMNKTEVV